MIYTASWTKADLINKLLWPFTKLALITQYLKPAFGLMGIWDSYLLQVALELIKIVGGYPADAYKNCFLNLAIPIMVFTETAEVRRTEIR